MTPLEKYWVFVSPSKLTNGKTATELAATFTTGMCAGVDSPNIFNTRVNDEN